MSLDFLWNSLIPLRFLRNSHHQVSWAKDQLFECCFTKSWGQGTRGSVSGMSWSWSLSGSGCLVVWGHGLGLGLGLGLGRGCLLRTSISYFELQKYNYMLIKTQKSAEIWWPHGRPPKLRTKYVSLGTPEGTKSLPKHWFWRIGCSNIAISIEKQ